MARHTKRSNDSSDGDPNRPARPRRRVPKTDLSIFLHYPLATLDEDAFRGLCDQIRGLLSPRTDLEERGVDMILWAFERIRRGLKAVDHNVTGADRYLSTMLEAFRSRQRTFELLRKIVDTVPQVQDQPLNQAPSPHPFRPSEPAPKSDPEPEDVPEVEVDELAAAVEDWRARIAMVPAYDPRWPVLDQFNLRVDDVLTLRDRGVPEDEILDRHPGLTYSDLVSCYSCEAEGFRGPLEPPYSNQIALVIDDGPEED